MDPHESDREETNENRRNIYCPLHKLVTILKTFPQNLRVFPEISLLDEFSRTKFFPFMVFNPKWIIERMLRIHRECANYICKNPTYLKNLVYKYNYDEKEEEYVFSNNMMFHADIITICFLYYIVEEHETHRTQSMDDLMIMMKIKYRIRLKYDERMMSDPQIVTLEKIIFSFPSIIFGMFYHNDVKILNFLSKILFDWNLTNIFCSPWLASIIPVLETEFKTPLALLLVVIAALDVENKPTYVLYQRILTLYTSELFPKRLKLKLCKKLGIVYKTENEYKFASYFTTHRAKILDLLISLKRNDPSLEFTLSKI